MNYLEQANDQPATKTCLLCGDVNIVPGKPNPLCSSCRESAIKYPIPSWVKGFGIAILLLLALSVCFLPSNLSEAIALQKGIKAEQQKNFVTAEQYFQQAVKLMPANTAAYGHLMLASYYNGNFYSFAEAANNLSGKQIPDNEQLIKKLNILFAKADYYFAPANFTEIENRYKSIDSIPDSVYIHYIKTNEEKLYVQTSYANSLLNQKRYYSCDSIAHIILDTDEENLAALTFMASAKRFENQPDSSIFFCNRILAMNNELLYAKVMKARALLKMKKNNEALQLALDCNKADSTDAYTKATLALIYHFNHQVLERDAIIRQSANKDSISAQIFQYVFDVMNNKETL